ncbi:hypothetical protein BDV11DRAFT_65479 [Aspergillus similis]
MLTEAWVASVESTATGMRRSIPTSNFGMQWLPISLGCLLLSCCALQLERQVLHLLRSAFGEKSNDRRSKVSILGERARASREPGEAPTECGIFRPNEAFPAVSSSRLPISASCGQPGGRMANNSLIQIAEVLRRPRLGKRLRG